MMTKLIATAAACLAVGIVLFGGVAGHRILAGHAARGVIRPVARALVVAEDRGIEGGEAPPGDLAGRGDREQSARESPRPKRGTSSWTSRAMRSS